MPRKRGEQPPVAPAETETPKETAASLFAYLVERYGAEGLELDDLKKSFVAKLEVERLNMGNWVTINFDTISLEECSKDSYPITFIASIPKGTRRVRKQCELSFTTIKRYDKSIKFPTWKMIPFATKDDRTRVKGIY